MKVIMRDIRMDTPGEQRERHTTQEGQLKVI